MSGRRAVAAIGVAGVALAVTCASEAQISGAPPPTPFPPVVQTQGTTAITGSVSLAIPDGGVYVNLGAATVPVAGDVNVLTAPRLEATVSTAPATWLAVAGDATGTVLRTETSGIAGAPVLTNTTILGTPTVVLSASSLTSITNATAERVCTYTVGDPDSVSVGTTAANIPASPLTGRTAITIWNLETTRNLWCNPSGTASATAAVPVPPWPSAQKFEGLNGATAVSCRCSTLTCGYAYLEERCTPPP